MADTVLDVTELSAGMVVAKGLIDDRGQFWLSGGAQLTDDLILKIRRLGIRRIAVVGRHGECQQEDENVPAHTDNLPEVCEWVPEETLVRSASNLSFQEEYAIVLENVRKLIGLAAATRELPYERITKTVEAIMPLVDEGFGQINYLAMAPRKLSYLVHHSLHVALYAGLIGSAIEPALGKASLHRLVMAGLVHDIGKLMINPEILEKPDVLTEEEMTTVRQHSALGYKWLRKIRAIHPETLLAVLQHHERLDGSGYPLQLAGTDKIYSFARILAVADTFDAMTSKRAFKGRISLLSVIRLLQQESFSRLDARYSRILVDNVIAHLVGDEVQLSDGRCGRLVYWANAEAYPVVMVDDEAVDLGRQRNLYISNIVGA